MGASFMTHAADSKTLFKGVADNFQVGEVIGKGAYGVVWWVEHQPNESDY